MYPKPVDEFEQTFFENTVLATWMRQWLNYVLWYSKVALDLNTPLGSLLDAPVVELSPRRRNISNEVKRFGLVWRLYAKAQEWGKQPLTMAICPPKPKEFINQSLDAIESH